VRLIINADDLGSSNESNKTIFLLHRQGLISSSTIIAGGDGFPDAIESIKDHPGMGIGVHLCLDGPFNIGREYKTLTDENTRQFHNNLEIIYRLKKFSADELEIFNEYCLQIERVMDHGIDVSHLDHHHHHHLYFPSLRSMIKAAKKYSIRYIRTQKILCAQDDNLMKALYKRYHQFYVKRRIGAIDGYFEPNAQSNTFDEEYTRLSKLLSMRKKNVEIMLHPKDVNDPETSFFTSREVKTLLERHEIISYRDLSL